ncbi:hypothetical protein, partial [Mesorhizobium sp. M7A.F.Ca.CA.001.09.1.1]
MLLHLLDTATQASNAHCRQPFYSFASDRRGTVARSIATTVPYSTSLPILHRTGAWHIARNLCHREANSAELDYRTLTVAWPGAGTLRSKAATPRRARALVAQTTASAMKKRMPGSALPPDTDIAIMLARA